MFFVALISSCSLLVFSGCARMPLASSQYITIMYLFPVSAVTGKRPHRSVAIFPPISVVARNAQFVRVAPVVSCGAAVISIACCALLSVGVVPVLGCGGGDVVY